MMMRENDGKIPGLKIDLAKTETFRQSHRHLGVFGWWRSLRDRQRARVAKWWAHYLEHAVPANEDDVPEGWPRIFAGTLGRWLLAGCTILTLAVWVVLLTLLWNS